jgi:hypothetical protein
MASAQEPDDYFHTASESTKEDVFFMKKNEKVEITINGHYTAVALYLRRGDSYTNLKLKYNDGRMEKSSKVNALLKEASSDKLFVVRKLELAGSSDTLFTILDFEINQSHNHNWIVKSDGYVLVFSNESKIVRTPTIKVSTKNELKLQELGGKKIPTYPFNNALTYLMENINKRKREEVTKSKKLLKVDNLLDWKTKDTRVLSVHNYIDNVHLLLIRENKCLHTGIAYVDNQMKIDHDVLNLQTKK